MIRVVLAQKGRADSSTVECTKSATTVNLWSMLSVGYCFSSNSFAVSEANLAKMNSGSGLSLSLSLALSLSLPWLFLDAGLR